MKTYPIIYPTTVGEILSRFEACLNGLYDVNQTLLHRVAIGEIKKRTARKILSGEIETLLGKTLIGASVMIALQNTFNKNGVDPEDMTDRHKLSQGLRKEINEVLRYCRSLKPKYVSFDNVSKDVLNLTRSGSVAWKVINFLKKYYASDMEELLEIEIIETDEILSTTPESHETWILPPGASSDNY